MKQITSRMNRFLSFLVCLGLVFAVLGFDQVGVSYAKDPPPGEISWDISVDVNTPADGLRGSGGDKAMQAQLESELNVKLRGKGYTYGVERMDAGSYRVAVSGKGTFSKLRRVLYSDLGNNLGILGGSSELIIRGTAAADQLIPVVLESNPSTGYIWALGGDTPFVEAQPAEFKMKTQGRGAPEKQIVYVKASQAGELDLRLVYNRHWESDQPVTRHVAVRTASLPDSIDLSDPTPVKELSSLPVVTQPQPAVEGDPQPVSLRGASPSDPSYDLRTAGYVTPVRDQGNCGSCWAFGTVAAMESNLLYKSGLNTDLSEQFLVSCNKDRWNCEDGGLTANKYHQSTLAKAQTVAGAVMEANMPYTATNGKCKVAYNHPYFLGNWSYLRAPSQDMNTYEALAPGADQAEAVQNIKTAIVSYGAVNAAICAGYYFYHYNGTLLSTGDYCDGSTNHQIAIVGWDETGTDYFIVRNSWGSGWGNGGYLNVSYNLVATDTNPYGRLGEGATYVDLYTSAAAVPGNDNVGSADDLAYTGGSFTDTRSLDIFNATTEGTDPTYSASIGQGLNSVWYKFTPAAKGTLKLNTLGSSYDSVLGLFDGTGGTGVLARRAWNDNRSRSNRTSAITYKKIKANTPYYIEIAGRGGYGEKTLSLSASFTAAKPANDRYKKPKKINFGITPTYSDRLDVLRAGIESRDAVVFGGATVYRTVYYKFRPLVPGTVSIDVSRSNYAPIVNIYSTADGSLALPGHVQAGSNYWLGIASPDAGANGILDFDVTFVAD